MTSLADSPITVESHDLFGRSILAEFLADFLLQFPSDTSHRVGLYGEWGSGKTSVLELVRRSLEGRGHVTVWLVPWTLESSDDVLKRLLTELAEKLKIRQKPWSKWTDCVSQTIRAGAEATRLAEGLDLRITLAMRVARPILDGVAENLKLKHGPELLTEIERRIGDRRIVVIVDDLDRTPPATVPKILLMLREAMSLPGMHYLLALSPEIVKKGLSNEYPEFSADPQDFLDKIVEYPFWLPTITEDNIQQATTSLIEVHSSYPHPTAILKLGTHLPTNPRQLKLFLRLINSLSDQLNRYSENEIDLQATFLVQMLRLEFPVESQHLIEDKEVVKSIGGGVILERLRTRDEPDELVPETHVAPKSPRGQRERFLQLCQAIRECNVDYTNYNIVDLYHLAERPPTITRKEFGRLVEAKSKEPKGFREMLLKLLGGANAKDKETRIEAIWNHLILGREEAWGNAIDADDQATIRKQLEVLRTIDTIIREFGVEIGFFDDGILGSSHWMLFWERVIDWDRFIHLVEYHPLRESERTLALDLASRMTDEHKADTWMRLRYGSGFGHGTLGQSRSAELKELERTLLNTFQQCAVNLALEAFETPQGVREFWGRDNHTPQKQVAFDPESCFHRRRARTRLLTTAVRAVEEVAIQRNFLSYLRMLLTGAIDDGSFGRDQCIKLLSDGELVRIVSRASFATPLNPRVVGSLKRDLAKARDAEILSLEDVHRPNWWTAMEESTSKKR